MKRVFSLFLFLTYFVGLAHTVIPHCHSEDVHSHVEVNDDLDHHHHDHHNHDSEKTSDHEHIAHNDHLDGDLLDLFACIFNEVEHEPLSNNDNHLASNTEVLVKSGFQFLPYQIVLDVSLVNVDGQSNQPNKEVATIDLLVALSESPLRGPPQVSC